MIRAVVVLVAFTSVARAGDYMPKKDRERLGKTDKHDALPALGTKPAKLINLYNQWTHDWLAIDPAQLPGGGEVNQFLRDHFTNESTDMDKRLVGILVSASKQFKSDIVLIVSGFRHPKFNLMLRKKGHQVARDSQHTHGHAVDFMIPRIPVAKLHAWAKAQKIGGVGIYPSNGFVHMDTGPIRYWTGD